MRLLRLTRFICVATGISRVVTFQFLLSNEARICALQVTITPTDALLAKRFTQGVLYGVGPAETMIGGMSFTFEGPEWMATQSG